MLHRLRPLRTAAYLAAWAASTGGCDGSGGESCATCLEEKCADLADLCRAEKDCACMVDCLGRTGIDEVAGCVDDCSLTARPAAFLPVETCVSTACPDGDECSVPKGHVAPPTGTLESNDAGVGSGPIGGGTLADCAFEPGLAFDPLGELLQLVSADGTVCVRVERRNEGAGDLANTRWTLVGARVGSLGAVAEVSDAAALCWYSSHHNFADWAHVWTGARHHDIELTLDGHGGVRSYTLHTFEAGPLGADACAPLADGVRRIGAPVELVPFTP